MTVPFYGNSLYVVNHNGEPYTPMKPIVKGMGMDWKSQYAKLKQRFAKAMVEITIPTAGGFQRMACLPLRKLAGWLQTISPNKVKPEIREKVIQYQNECDDVLYEYWTKGVAVNPRINFTDATREANEIVRLDEDSYAIASLGSKMFLLRKEALKVIREKVRTWELKYRLRLDIRDAKKRVTDHNSILRRVDPSGFMCDLREVLTLATPGIRKGIIQIEKSDNDHKSLDIRTEVILMNQGIFF